MNRSRITGDLVSQNNIFVDIANDRVGIGSTIPAHKLSLPDSAKIALGNSADLTIYHDGTNSHLVNNTGYLNIQAKSGENSVFLARDGEVNLYFDGSKKFETTNNGVTVTGSIVATSNINATGDVNADGNVTISNTAPTLYLTDTNANSDYSIVVNTGEFRVRDETNSANRFYIASDGTANFNGNLNANAGLDVTGAITGTGDLTLTDTTADSAAGPEFKLFRNSASPADADYLGQIKFAGESDTGVERNYAKITGKILDASNGTEDGILEFAHIKAGSQTITGRWRSDSLQLLNGTNLSVNGTSTFEDDVTFTGANYNVVWDKSDDALEFVDNAKLAIGTGSDLKLYHNGAHTYIRNTTGVLHLDNYDGDIKIRPKDSEDGIKVITDGAVELYHNNEKKFETTSQGGKITDSNTTADLQFTTSTGNNGYVWADNADVIGFRDANPHWLVKCIKDGAVELYHDNSKKLETASHGATLTGNLRLPDNTSGNASIQLGNSQDFFMNHNGTHSYIINNTGNLYIRDLNGDVHIQGKDAEESIIAKADGAVELYYDNALRLRTQSNHLELYGNASESNIEFFTVSSGTNYVRSLIGVTNNGTMSFYTNGGTQKMAISCVPNGAVELYHNATKCFETNSVGIKVLGAEGGVAQIDIQPDEGDDNADKWKVGATDNGYFFISNKASGGWETNIECNSNGNVELYHDNTKRLETTSSGVEIPHALFVGEKIDMPDHTSGTNGMILLGTGDDLYMYHDGTNSHLRNNTGTFNIRAGSFRLTDAAIQHVYLKTNDGGNDEIDLYYDNSVKLSTTSAGVHVTGALNVTTTMHIPDGGVGLQFGNSNDMIMYHNGSNSFIQHQGTGDLYIDSLNNSADIYIRSKDNLTLMTNSNSQSSVSCVGNGGVILYNAGTAKFNTDADGAVVTSQRLAINRNAGDAFIEFQTSGTTHATCYGGATTGWRVFTKPSSGSLTERLRITSSGMAEMRSDMSASDQANRNIFRFTDTDTSTTSNQSMGRLQWFSSDGSGGGACVKAEIEATADDTTPEATLSFKTHTGSGTTPTTRMEIKNEGSIKQTSTGYFQVAKGTTAQRPTGVVGMVRFNTTTDQLENFNATTGWVNVNVKTPTITSISGNIYNGFSTNLTINGTDFDATVTVIFKEGSTTRGTLTNQSVSSGSLTVAVPSGVYGQSAGDTITITVTNTDGVVSAGSNKTIQTSPSGGTITTSGNYRIHSFTSSGNFVNTVGSLGVEYLVIAGGGAGGSAGSSVAGGGGGAGGYRSNVSGQSSGGGNSAESAMTLSATTYAVVVGAGAAANPGTSDSGASRGSNSSFNSITSTGGGGGGGNGNDSSQADGGSGGGGKESDGSGGAGTSGQGYDGGDGSEGNNAGGGGGGAGEEGNTDSFPSGGDGVSSNITGSAVTRGGGGGSGSTTGQYTFDTGGDGGGGRGSTAHDGSAPAENGTANTGGGGGGGFGISVGASGAGGSGIVIIRYNTTTIS